MKNNNLMSLIQIRLLIFVLMAVLSVAASMPVRATPPNKTLIYCSEGRPAGFDPAQSTTSVEYTASAFSVHNRLIEFKPGGTEIFPSLAAHWDISPDGFAIYFLFAPRREISYHIIFQANKGV